jgi:hypothetical protein
MIVVVVHEDGSVRLRHVRCYLGHEDGGNALSARPMERQFVLVLTTAQISCKTLILRKSSQWHVILSILASVHRTTDAKMTPLSTTKNDSQRSTSRRFDERIPPVYAKHLCYVYKIVHSIEQAVCHKHPPFEFHLLAETGSLQYSLSFKSRNYHARILLRSTRSGCRLHGNDGPPWAYERVQRAIALRSRFLRHVWRTCWKWYVVSRSLTKLIEVRLLIARRYRPSLYAKI